MFKFFVVEYALRKDDYTIRSFFVDGYERLEEIIGSARKIGLKVINEQSMSGVVNWRDCVSDVGCLMIVKVS